MSNGDNEYDLVLRQFNGDRLVSVYHLQSCRKLEAIKEAGELVAQAMWMKSGSELNGLPTWLNYFPDADFCQLIIVEHDGPTQSLQEPTADRAPSDLEQELSNSVFKYERLFAHLLNNFIGQTAKEGKIAGINYRELSAYRLTMAAMVDYHNRRFMPANPVLWNPPGRPSRATAEFLMAGRSEELTRAIDNGTPVSAAVCKDHPAVEPVSYEEVAMLLGTSGCSREEPYWIYDVLGKIRSDRGVQIVCPGDWILDLKEGVYLVLKEKDFRALFSTTNLDGEQ